MTASTSLKNKENKKLMSDSKKPQFPIPKEFVIGQRVNPLIANMPAHLKDPKNFEKIQRAILDAGATRHSHAEIGDWAKCLKCMQKMQDRKLMMNKLGFTSAAQYRVWHRIHEKIKKMMPLI